MEHQLESIIQSHDQIPRHWWRRLKWNLAWKLCEGLTGESLKVAMALGLDKLSQKDGVLKLVEALRLHMFGLICLWRSSLITQSCQWYFVLSAFTQYVTLRYLASSGLSFPWYVTPSSGWVFPRYEPSQVQYWFRTSKAQWNFRSAQLPMQNSTNLCSSAAKFSRVSCTVFLHVLMNSCDSYTLNRMVLHH